MDKVDHLGRHGEEDVPYEGGGGCSGLAVNVNGRLECETFWRNRAYGIDAKVDQFHYAFSAIAYLGIP